MSTKRLMIRRKIVLNKRTVIVASSIAAIPLAAVLIAAATHRARHKSPQTSGFLGRTGSKASVITTATDMQQQKDKSQGQVQSPWRGSETKATTTIAAIPINTTITDKHTTTSAAVPSPLVPSSTSDSEVIISSQIPKEEEISVSDEARKAGESLKEFIVTAIKEAKDSAKETGKRLKEQTINIATTVDSKDIRSLGDNVNASVRLFEETMIEIRKEPYDDQIKLLERYKDLLRTHIKVVDARGRMASKLKPGS
jgi:enamine deaminase RidA (YjgF/YER057c/UK114 family)